MSYRHKHRHPDTDGGVARARIEAAATYKWVTIRGQRVKVKVLPNPAKLRKGGTDGDV